MDKEDQKAQLIEELEDVTQNIVDLDQQRQQLAVRRRTLMWKLLRCSMSLAEVAKFTNMHRGAVHKDLSRHPVPEEIVNQQKEEEN